ncbi:MAG: hypothetical protein HQM08_13985 [Candidatus Riflebacteria bacterium]|nr:hypothetical protein [Candidatus Riflebacteria bacterium]
MKQGEFQSNEAFSAPSGRRMILAIVGICLNLVIPLSFPIFFGFYTLVLCVVIIINKIPLVLLIKKLILLEIFLLIMAIGTLTQPNGFNLFVSLMIKSTLSLSTLIILIQSSSSFEIPRILVQWGIPEPIPSIIALLLRYSGVLQKEIHRMKQARDSRLFVASTKFSRNSLVALISRVFSRSIDRSERIYSAMVSRGWK